MRLYPPVERLSLDLKKGDLMKTFACLTQCVAGPVILFALVGFQLSGPLQSHFECKNQGSGTFRPFYLQAVDGGTVYKDYSQTAQGLLGQNAMSSGDECQQALAS